MSARDMQSACPVPARDVREGSILLKKSKIERLQKSRESRFLIISAAASRRRADTKVCDRFCVNRCGPSRCRARDAPAVLKNFLSEPEKTFSTVSVKSGSYPPLKLCRLVPQKQTFHIDHYANPGTPFDKAIPSQQPQTLIFEHVQFH
jgi:hypothetical protein